jgi:hypothetical protein
MLDGSAPRCRKRKQPGQIRHRLHAMHSRLFVERGILGYVGKRPQRGGHSCERPYSVVGGTHYFDSNGKAM